MSFAYSVLAEGLSPSNDEARQWVRDELSSSNYQPDQPSWLDRLSDSLSRWFGERAFEAIFGDNTWSIVFAVVIGVLALALIGYSLRFVRRRRKAPSAVDIEPVLGTESLSAKAFRARAEQLLAAGDFDGCVRDAMRALTRRSAERSLLTDAPSLTAHEVAVRLRGPFPGHVHELLTAASLFDSVAYGGRHATEAQARSVLDLDTALKSTRPAGTGTDAGLDVGFAVPR
ncbi:DUF4129 domain-containing protein [Gordonia desulfuricans]|uniref:DUF4129 domain-containing protein n=1 Tax=Gordonia desulfuricans TaxID=89051 RepID=A0A7K3LPM0_9ACTN|nr:DUF4129 domain-containing protein [Gordonia desulfuricans]NDK90192.1 DUF4129 domain-containing protein [Gordonia desulfuricans]